MHQRACGFCAAERPSEDGHGSRQEYRGEEEQDDERLQNGMQSGSANERSAHGIERIGYGIQACDELQPIRQDADRKEHATRNTRYPEDEPLCGIPPLEKQKIRSGKHAKS